MLFAAAAMAFASCSKDRAETDIPENKVSIRFAAIADEHDAGGAESRTSFDGESYTIRWQGADRVGIYIDATAPTTNAEAAPNLQTVPVTFEAATGSYQKGDLIYAYYPYTAAAQADAKAVCLTIPPVQTQAAVGSTNFNGSCNPLVAVPRPAAGASENGATEELRFRQTAAMAEYDIVTSNPAYEGEQIKSVAYTANGEEYIAGTFRYDLTAVPETGALPPVDRTTLSEDKSKSIEVILTTAGTVGGKSATDTNLVYMAAIPGTYEGTLTVTTDKAIYTFPPKKALELPRAFVRRILLDLGTVLPENRQETGAPAGIVVHPGDDLAAIIGDPDRTEERIYLEAGEYTLDATVALKSNLELYSDDPSQTTVTMAKNFLPKGTLDRIVFRNIRFNCATYLCQITNTDYDIGLYRIENCIVDLNSGATGNSTLFSTSGTAANASLQILRTFEVENSLVFANKGQTQNIVYAMSSTSGIPRFGKLLLRNSTFANCARGLVANSGPEDYAFEVTIENCTLYNIACGGNYAVVDIRNKGNANQSKRSVSLRNSVLWFGGSNYKILQFAGSGEGQYVPKEQIDCTNFYHFAAQAPTFGSSYYNIADRMTAYNGAPADLWQNPMADPSAAGASFRIKDQSVRAAQEAAGTTLGDPRWE